MNIASYRLRNNLRRVATRLRYPPPVYKRGGGIAAVVIRKDGTKDDLGTVADVWTKRWGADSS